MVTNRASEKGVYWKACCFIEITGQNDLWISTCGYCGLITWQIAQLINGTIRHYYHRLRFRNNQIQHGTVFNEVFYMYARLADMINRHQSIRRCRIIKSSQCWVCDPHWNSKHGITKYASTCMHAYLMMMHSLWAHRDTFDHTCGLSSCSRGLLHRGPVWPLLCCGSKIPLITQ